MNIDIIANSRVSPCIAHDAPFAASPLWVRYETGARALSIVFEDGAAHRLDTPVNEDIAQHLKWARKIMLVQMRDGRPVEGYECFLRKYGQDGQEVANV